MDILTPIINQFMDNGTSTILQLATNVFNSNDPKQIIKYSFLICGFLFFVGGWDITSIVVIIVVFLIFVLLIKMNGGITKLLPDKANKINDIINKTIPKLIPEFPHLDEYKDVQPILDKFKGNIQELTNYILELKNNLNDPSFLKLLASLIILIKSYISEVGKLLIGIKQQLSTSNPYQDFQNIKNIQTNLFKELDSLYFKLDPASDKKTHEILDTIKETIRAMNNKLEDWINEDFESNTASNKSPVLSDDYPIPYNDNK